MEDIKYIRTTSKQALKDSCLFVSKGDYVKAQEIYDFYAKDMNLPDFDIKPPSALVQTKNIVMDTWNGIKENKDDLIDLVVFFRSLLGKGASASTPSAPVNPLPPI